MAARRTRLAAIAVSAVLHAAIVGAVLNASWTRIEPAPAASIDVVWVERLPSPVEAPVVDDEPEPPEAAEAVDERVTDDPPAAEPGDDREPSGDEMPAPPDEARAERPADAPAEDEAPADAPDDARERPRRVYTVRDVDIDDAWRAALEQTREQRRQQDGYRSFSLDDVLPAPEPEEPGPAESVFETAKQANRAPSVLAPGKASTRFGQRLARLCNELTGGFSLMGFAAVCADQEALPKLFAHLKPEYLRARPECTEVDAPSAIAGEGNAVKCRLVLDDDPTFLD